MRPRCPKCNKLLVMPSGPPKSKVILVGEFPGKDEIISGIPFVGRAGEILANEMSYIGLHPSMFRITNLWLHQKDKECDENWHLTQLMKEIRGRRVALLMGSDLANIMFDKSITDLTGLVMKNDKAKGVKLLMSYNPALLIHSPAGEFKLAMREFRNLLERERLL